MANEIRLRNNNISGTITDNPLTNVATTINSPGFVDLPTVTAVNHLILILDPLEINGTAEIVQVTAHTAAASSVTVVRGFDGSSARAHILGTTWFHGPVASDYNLTDIAALSTNRPASPTQGQLIYETDTNSYVGRAAGSVWQTVVPLGAWTSFTPTLVQLGAVTKTVNYARFIRIGRLIISQVRLTVTGSGTGANNVFIGLPVTAAGADGRPWGTGEIFDTSAGALYSGNVITLGTTDVIIRAANTSVSALGTTTFTAGLAAGDEVGYSIMYEAAS